MNRQILEKPFDQNQIKQREGNFGRTLDYVEGHSIIQRLNDAFDAAWSFTILKHEILTETDEVIVVGQLNADGIVKSQFGSSKITRARESGEIISLADDLKAAATDALKKAATLLGVGLHLYRNDPPQTGNREPAHQNNGFKSKSKGNGGNGSGNDRNSQNGNSRLSSKQYNYILTLAKDRGITRSELNNQCLEAFNVVLEHISKRDASSIIERLKGE